MTNIIKQSAFGNLVNLFLNLGDFPPRSPEFLGAHTPIAETQRTIYNTICDNDLRLKTDRFDLKRAGELAGHPKFFPGTILTSDPDLAILLLLSFESSWFGFVHWTNEQNREPR
jgi:hypothetical protein